MAGYPLTGQIGPASVLAVLKLILHPILAWVIAVPILGLGAPWAPVVVVIAGMPSGAMVYLFGARYQTASDVAAGTVVVASAASVVTLSIRLVLMGALATISGASRSGMSGCPLSDDSSLDVLR